MIFNEKLTVHDTCRLTNTTFPIQNYFTSKTFPLQDKTKLGTEIEIQIRSNQNAVVQDKPILDNTRVFVLRYDTEPPFLSIAIGTDRLYKGCIFVFHNNVDNDNQLIARYPDQQYNYYLRYTNDLYNDYKFLEDAILGRIVRCDASEPAFAVVSEVINNKLRFITVDEAICLTNHATTTIHNTESDVYDFVEQELGDYELDDGTRDSETNNRFNRKGNR